MCRILVVEDDLAQLGLRKSLLEGAGHEVAVAFTPDDALRQTANGWAQILVVDLRYLNAAGEQDSREGLALIRGIREQGCQSPVIVLSGWPEDLYGEPEERMVSRVMVKPVPARELLDAVETLVGALP
jgi:DNA-binding response OmpR family regulator